MGLLYAKRHRQQQRREHTTTNNTYESFKEEFSERKHNLQDHRQEGLRKLVYRKRKYVGAIDDRIHSIAVGKS